MQQSCTKTQLDDHVGIQTALIPVMVHVCYVPLRFTTFVVIIIERNDEAMIFKYSTCIMEVASAHYELFVEDLPK